MKLRIVLVLICVLILQSAMWAGSGQAQEIQVYKGRDLEAEQRDQRQSFGSARISVPRGWRQTSNTGTLIVFEPSGLPGGASARISFLPDRPVQGSFSQWFNDAIHELQQGEKLVNQLKVTSRQDGNEVTLMTASHTSDSKGDHYRMYAATKIGNKAHFSMYSANSAEILDRYQKDFGSFLDQMHSSGQTQDAPPSEPAVTRPPNEITPANRAGNLVEPLSNGLQLSMTDSGIKAKFGPPSDPTWDSRTYGYPGISLQVGGARGEIWHVTLKQGVRLNSGIAVGSTRNEVASVFGNADSVRYDQYQLTFDYSGTRVSSIKIDPANGSFAPYSKTANPSNSPANPNPAPTPAPAQGSSSLAGDWYCVSPSSTVGTIKMKADGTYTFGQNSGTYSVQGKTVTFSGIPWNNGRASLSNGNLEFYWKTGDGAIQYFAFAKY